MTRTVEANHGSIGAVSVSAAASTTSSTATIVGASYSTSHAAIPMIEDTTLGYRHSAAPAVNHNRPAFIFHRP